MVSSPPATSDPPCGSESPNAPIVSIRRMLGNQRCRCSSDPRIEILLIASELCTLNIVPVDGSTRANSISSQPVSSLREALRSSNA